MEKVTEIKLFPSPLSHSFMLVSQSQTRLHGTEHWVHSVPTPTILGKLLASSQS